MPSTKAYSTIYVPRRTRQLSYGRFGEGGGDNGESKMLFEGGRHGALTGYLVSLFFGVGVTTTRPSRNTRLALEKGLRVVRDPDDGGDAAAGDGRRGGVCVARCSASGSVCVDSSYLLSASESGRTAFLPRFPDASRRVIPEEDATLPGVASSPRVSSVRGDDATGAGAVGVPFLVPELLEELASVYDELGDARRAEECRRDLRALEREQ